MKLAFISQPWATALPPSESIVIGTKAIAERLVGEHEPTIWARAAGPKLPPLGVRRLNS
jgi:hypothetical protein